MRGPHTGGRHYTGSWHQIAFESSAALALHPKGPSEEAQRGPWDRKLGVLACGVENFGLEGLGLRV